MLELVEKKIIPRNYSYTIALPVQGAKRSIRKGRAIP
jgi:hypothetical protein